MNRSVEINYKEYWVIRVIKDNKEQKKVVKEIECSTPPTEQDVVDVLIKCNSDEFVSIAHNFRMR